MRLILVLCLFLGSQVFADVLVTADGKLWFTGGSILSISVAQPPSGWTDTNTASLLAVYYFETTNGAPTYVDSWTNDYHLTPMPTVGTGPTGGIDLGPRAGGGNETAIELDGLDDYLNMNPQYSGGISRTIAMWVKRRDTNTPSANLYLYRERGAAFYYSTTPEIRYQFSDGGFTTGASGQTITDTNWHHVVAVWESGFGARLYFDGTQVDTDTSRTGNMITNILSINVGASTGGATPWDGWLDDFRPYNTNLSPSSISNLYLNTLHPTDSIEARLDQ